MTNKKLYLIGDPVDHSLSPLLHGAMIAQTGVHYTYEVRRVQPRDLADFVAEAKAGGPARADGVEALDGLVAVAQRVGKGIQP